ncbi:sensor histidine kinase [Rugosimonospora africana]|uniref:histidine kinase n=1 Tax=Rugosimonospora africana TaxID=556532 RepID=A0A8J3QVU8_9ACTN|nr:HAMP domain-containing sensor histidine kinase [Rugosimonospora africana]GIH15711.1 sensor histidine kinase [Rugosimonospora africana]
MDGRPAVGKRPTADGRTGRPARGRRGRPSRWPLRTRLVAAVAGLLAVVCLIVGGVTEFALHGFLMRQVDGQLGDASRRFFGMATQESRPPGGGGGPPPFPVPTGQSAGTLQAGVVNDAVRYAYVVLGDPVSATDYPVLERLPVDGRPHTRVFDDLGSYRLVAMRLPDGGVIVTGLPLAGVHSTLMGLGLVEGAVALAGLVVTGLAGAVIVRRSLRPLHRMAATATRVAELPLDRGEVALPVRVPDVDTDPATEVGQVGAALNRMLGHIAAALSARQASETRVRQFVADASHELRTPLAAIRGYAELARRVHEPVPDDVAHALRRVESESARMTALVEDLLLLARLDSGRPLAADPVDLTRLVVDATGDAHVAGPSHSWRLDLPEEPVVVVGDASRLHQVLVNLLGNARAHTPAGTTVTVTLSRPDRAAAVLAVADDGPGIPDSLLPDVFDRFARADNSRSRAAGSTGLGLSIVEAVVEAHGGTIGVSSQPGHTVFTVTLPLQRSGEVEPASAVPDHL